MASTSTPTPQPTLPSVQQESTIEEDYFAELLLDDDEDAELDSVVKPKKKSREERMNEAVEISKREYRFEHGITEPWWSLGLDRHPHHFERDRNVSGDDWVDVADLRIIEMNIVQLYYQRELERAFNLSLRLLCPSRFADIPVADTSTEIIPYDPEMSLCWDKTSREVVETMMRVVLRTGTRGWGGILADGTRRSWTQGSSGPMAEVAARCYALDERYQDAFVAISYAIVDRGLLRPFQKTLLDILVGWSVTEGSTEKPENPGRTETVEIMRTGAEHCVKISHRADRPMFRSEGENIEAGTNSVEDIPERGTEPEFTLRFSHELGFTDETELKIMDKAWKRVSGLLVARRKGAGGLEDDEDGMQGGRSVRTL